MKRNEFSLLEEQYTHPSRREPAGLREDEVVVNSSVLKGQEEIFQQVSQEAFNYKERLLSPVTELIEKCDKQMEEADPSLEKTLLLLKEELSEIIEIIQGISEFDERQAITPEHVEKVLEYYTDSETQDSSEKMVMAIDIMKKVLIGLKTIKTDEIKGFISLIEATFNNSLLIKRLFDQDASAFLVKAGVEQPDPTRELDFQDYPELKPLLEIREEILEIQEKLVNTNEKILLALNGLITHLDELRQQAVNKKE